MKFCGKIVTPVRKKVNTSQLLWLNVQELQEVCQNYIFDKKSWFFTEKNSQEMLEIFTFLRFTFWLNPAPIYGSSKTICRQFRLKVAIYFRCTQHHIQFCCYSRSWCALPKWISSDSYWHRWIDEWSLVFGCA